MNDGLHDAFRHNTWATRELLVVCQSLTETQLHMTAPGTYGSIIATLWHTVRSDASSPATDGRRTVLGLARRSSTESCNAGRIPRRPRRALGTLLAQPFDADRTFVIKWDDDADFAVPAGVVLAQALHHGNEHRAQICTVLTSIGVPAPDLGVWEFAAATQRAAPHQS